MADWGRNVEADRADGGVVAHAHACAGMNVARLEARIAIGRLLVRFPGIDLAGAPERDPRVRFRGFRRLPVRLG